MRCLAFDLGKVVFDFDYGVALERIRGKIKASSEEVIEELFYRDFAADFERGKVSSQDFYEKFIRRFGGNLKFDEFKDIWSRIFTPQTEIISLIEKLRILYPTYLISNINELHFNYLYREFPSVFSLFDGMVLSFQVKEIKPAQEIYEELRDISSCSFEEIVYIDDRRELIEGASSLGIKGIIYMSPEQLVDELTRKGIIIPSISEISTLGHLQESISKKNNPLIVGVGNRMRSDDMAGSLVAEAIEDKVYLKVIDVQHTLENYLDKIRAQQPDLVILVDVLSSSSESRFGIFLPSQIIDEQLTLTHNASLKMAIQYLQESFSLDILILGIKGREFTLGGKMSTETSNVVNALISFFIRHFSRKERVAHEG